MEERQLKNIKRYLQNADVQERIQQHMQRGRSEATVSIGRVAQLFQLKESKLRDWETRGLLKPLRSKDVSGQRQYTPTELDKLAIIKELIDEGGYGPSDIPTDIDNLWYSIARYDGQQAQAVQLHEAPVEQKREADHMPIDKRISHAYYKELFWRYYASHALRLSLMLICEEIPNTIAGLILPLQMKHDPTPVPHPENLPQLGESLVGWLGQSRSFYTFLTLAPSFEHPSDFRILRLQVMEEDIPKEDAPRDGTLIVVQRTTVLTLSKPVVEVVRRLLEPLYNEVANWHFYFGQGMRDLLDPLIDFSSGRNLPDTILTNMAKRVVHLGGKTPDDQYRWRFCCILTPNAPHLPLQQRSLVVRAKTREAPSTYKIGATIVSPDEPSISLSLRAFQSGRIIYRHRVTAEDASVAHRELEEPIGSAIAVPVGGEDGLPVAVMYIVSVQADAFNDDDQRLLRMIGRMLEELLKTYQVRLQVADKFAGLITNPGVVDPVFADFASESDFIKDVEDLLSNMKILAEGKESVHKEELADPDVDLEVLKKVEQSSDAVSFIAIDIDNQTSLTNKYGYQMTKNLSRAVGLKIQRQLDVLFTNPSDWKLYHIYADRFFLLLKGVSLEKAREIASLLKQDLNGTYQVDALRSSTELPRLTDSIHVPAEITVRLGVASYLYAKLEEVLQRYPIEKALASATSQIIKFLDKMLKKGQDEGGNVIVSWDYQMWGFQVRPSGSKDI